MGHVWTWLDSKEEFFTESERSSCFQSPEDSSSLDFELSSWRESEEMSEVELEESSNQEEDHQRDEGDLAAWVTKLMEPLSIGSASMEPPPPTSSGSGEKNESGAFIQKEDIKGSWVYKEEEMVGEESHLPILKKEARGKSIPHIREKWALLVSEGLQDLSKEKGNDQIHDSTLDGQKVLNLPEESVGRTEEDRGCSLGFMVQIPHKWRTLSKEAPLCVKEEEEEAMEDAEEQAEDWKNSDFHLSYSNDDSSACGTPLVSSPCTNTASWPLMQLNQDDSLQQCLLFKKTLLSIWKMVAGHRYSGPFLKAVSEKQAPGYKDVVKRPVDLSSIKRGVSKGQIQNMIHFQRDLMLMFQNAIMYNNANHHIHRIAAEMQQEVLEQLQILGEALLCTEEMQDFVRRY